jgi:uncharacterized membrane protein YdbT with pleckstrin-like domain
MAVEKQLQVGEKVLYRAESSPLPLVPPIALAVVAGGGALFLWRMAAERPTLRWVALAAAAVALIALATAGVRHLILRSRHYVVTDRRVLRQVGILTKVSIDSQLEKINNVELRQPLAGRLLGYGDVVIDTASESGSVLFPQISRPLDFQRAILAAVEGNRGRHRNAAVPTVPIAPIGLDQIRQLKQLLDDGLISREEYEVKRKQVLDKA